jgi:hypothetical protein
MVVKKLTNVNVEKLPEEIKKNLQVLTRPKGEIVVIGSNYYEIYPLPAIKFLEILKEFFEILDALKQKKLKMIEMLANQEDDSAKEKLLKNVRVEFSDILSDEESYNKIVELLKTKILEGVDEEDFNNMTTSQFVYLINKLIQVNIDNFPPSIRNFVFPQQQNLISENKDFLTQQTNQ